MIYTITLNPAIDRTFWIQRIRDDVSNRILEEKSFAGGKSIDVSRVLKNLGIDNTALGFVGGFAGRELETSNPSCSSFTIRSILAEHRAMPQTGIFTRRA
ncbi:MAG: hypothetical protein M0Q43_06075 [Methanothrix sp.]|nr:hypothetical protein [Methanothrix sp.]MCK9565599.1 hypothetical protein [Methanothrix sp.]